MKSIFTSLSFLPLLLGIQSCSKAEQDQKPAIKDTVVVVKPPPVVTDTLPKSNYDLSLLEKCTLFTSVPTVTVLKNQDHMELSGLAQSQRYPGLLYVHEDSGNANEVYMTNTAGDDLGKIILDGVSNRDWEDIAYGPGPDAAKKYIYVAEIGDNDAIYKSIFVYRFAEPDLTNPDQQTVTHVTPDKLQFVYPTGAVNAESLMLDPATKDLYITTKETSRSTLYVARYPQSATTTTTLTPLAKFPFDLLTSADISPDGTEIIIRDTGQIWYWKRLSDETIVKAMLRQPQDAPYAGNEHQGEGICFAADGTGYFTTSETKKFPGDKSSLSFYKRK
jgi:hypothetical protein